MRSIRYNKDTLDPFNTSFLIALPIIGCVLFFFHLKNESFDARLYWAAFVMYALTTFSISAGYHRLFAHRAFQAHPVFKFFLLVFGAASGESTVLRWSSQHRVHHRYEDTDNDPYNIHQGFFFAHMGWVALRDPVGFEKDFGRDLLDDPLVMWQHRNALWIALIVNFLASALMGYWTGNWWGSFAIVGFLRVVFVHHITFCINSFAHMFGRKPYNSKLTARDSHLLGFFTFGEGYHNFHHAFQSDYRNGHRWYEWDPTKWILNVLSWVGVVKQFRRASPVAILRARLTVQQEQINQAQLKDEAFIKAVDELKVQVENALKDFIEMKKAYLSAKRNPSIPAIERQSLQERFHAAKSSFQEAYSEWRWTFRQACRSSRA